MAGKQQQHNQKLVQNDHNQSQNHDQLLQHQNGYQQQNGQRSRKGHLRANEQRNGHRKMKTRNVKNRTAIMGIRLALTKQYIKQKPLI